MNQHLRALTLLVAGILAAFPVSAQSAQTSSVHAVYAVDTSGNMRVVYAVGIGPDGGQNRWLGEIDNTPGDNNVGASSGQPYLPNR